ncbi:DUF177 domain-containing protein, partial [Lactococcus lactis]
ENITAILSETYSRVPVYDDDLFYLDYQIKTVLTLPSSRSLKPVEYPIDLLVNEIFATEESLRGNQELLDNDLIIILDKD